MSNACINSDTERRACGGRARRALIALLFVLPFLAQPLAGEISADERGRMKCNAYDLELVRLTEKASEEGKIEGNDVLELYDLTFKARRLCAERRYAEGVALYEAIIRLFF